MPALHPQRALCPAGTLAGRPILLVQQQPAAPRAANAAAVAAPTIPLPTTTTSTLRAMVMVGPPVRAGCGRRAAEFPLVDRESDSGPAGIATQPSTTSTCCSVICWRYFSGPIRYDG